MVGPRLELGVPQELRVVELKSISTELKLYQIFKIYAITNDFMSNA